MKVVYAKHPPYKDGHLADVADTMQHAGEPTIRCVERDGEYFALEGSHRLYLCHRYGIVPKLVLVHEELPSDGVLNNYWARVGETLPRYEFAHINVLDLR